MGTRHDQAELVAAEQALGRGTVDLRYQKNLPDRASRWLAAVEGRLAMLKAIHAGEDIAAAREKAIRVIEKLRGLRLSRAAELVEAAVEETLTYYAFPEEHWRRIRTNNPLERILREIRRRTRVVGAFPDGQSALNLAATMLRHIADTAWSTKRYLNIELLNDQQMRGAITA